ncbi:hypothetical protein H0H92_008835 [Tricholoma furcatifolium]|nr:hypothetical protein H0H92_008835 [Tricholoma furcatifolium]
MATDVYAWACVCFEIFVGKPPFHKINPAVLPLKISQGHRPRCPPPLDKAWTEWGLTEDIWTWVERCWHQDYRERPSAADIIQYLSLLLPIDVRQEPDITPILPAQFRDRMSQGLKANDVETLDHILNAMNLDAPTEASIVIDGDEVMESTASPTNIEEGLGTKITRSLSDIRFHPLPQNRGNDAKQFVHNGIKADRVILIIGPLGAGKTSFVNALFGNAGPQGHLNANSIQYHYGTVKDRRVCIVDAPGFQDDTTIDDEILRRISQWLIQSYPAGMKTMGIVYLQDITHIAVTERMKANLHSLQALDGVDDASVQMVFVTTMWSKVSQKVGEHCEFRLCGKYWKDPQANGLMMCRFDGTQDSALAVLDTVLSQRAPEGLFRLRTTAMKAIQTFFATNGTNIRHNVVALPVSKKYRSIKTDVLPQKPSAASPKIKLDTEDIIIVLEIDIYIECDL